MGAIVNSTFVSLDGVINHMDKWHFDYVDDQTDAFALQQLKDAGAMLMGRMTYEIYASAWPNREGEYPDLINALPKHVVSSTLSGSPAWNNSTVIQGDLESTAVKLKESTDGTILMHGFGPVAKTLAGAGLLDELHLWYHPVLAGVGEPGDVLLTPGLNAVFETTGTHVFDNGVVIMSMAKRA
jgi:dihydrofolate reductase